MLAFAQTDLDGLTLQLGRSGSVPDPRDGGNQDLLRRTMPCDTRESSASADSSSLDRSGYRLLPGPKPQQFLG